MNTVFALSTPIGNGVAVIRITGGKSLAALRSCFSHQGAYTPNMLYYGEIRRDGTVLDSAMAVYFKGPRSYTGEDSAELHCHGSYAVVSSVLSLLSSIGLSPAEPGEFTKRAFLNGKLDLSQAEAVMDLIHSTASGEAKIALDQLRGRLFAEVSAAQDEITDIIAAVEAGVDYPEEDWEQDIIKQNVLRISELCGRCDALLSGYAQGRVLREGLVIALVGRPNAGKSSLLNAITGENRAIVTAIPGTTRDVIECAMDWQGIPVRLLDTAGIRDTDDELESLGVELSKKAMEKADLLIAVIDGSSPFDDADAELIKAVGSKPCVIAVSKNDLEQRVDAKELAKRFSQPVVTASVLSRNGLEPLKSAVSEWFSSLSSVERPDVLVSNARHADALKKARQALCDAKSSLDTVGLDCACIDLRAAWNSLGLITGATAGERIIDRIFEKFCLGK